MHIKLAKEQHAALREKLFRFGITMQDLFREAAEMALAEGDRGEKLLQRIAKKKMKDALDRLHKKNHMQIGDLDSETLYNLLEDSDGAKIEE